MSLDPLLSSSLAIQIHTATAVAAFALGAVVLLRRKGGPLHRVMGRVWVALMLVVATSALFISELRLIGPFSPIHLFSIVTYVGLWQGFRAIRRRDVAAHRANMVGVYVAALILAGAFTFLPGRRMHETLFGPDAGWTPSLAVIGLGLALAFAIWRLVLVRARPLPAR